jgi:hypothetical protein
MNDRQLLESAAKAAGIAYKPVGKEGGIYIRFYGPWSERDTSDEIGALKEWNPLTDDDDALRLAVKLRIEIGFSGNGMQTWAVQPYKDIQVHEHIATNADLSAATRRAIVRAAATIGEQP